MALLLERGHYYLFQCDTPSIDFAALIGSLVTLRGSLINSESFMVGCYWYGGGLWTSANTETRTFSFPVFLLSCPTQG